MDGKAQSTLARMGPFEVNIPLGELRKHNLRLKLHDQPFKILAMLVTRPGELVTREEIRQHLWPSGTYVDFDNGLNSAVNRLRSVLGDSAESPEFIETVPRRGYRLIAPVELVASSPPASQESIVQASRQPRWTKIVRWPVAGGLAIAAGLGIFALAMQFAFRHPLASGTRNVEFHARDWALLTQFENRTGEPILDGTLEAALARELTNSQFVTVVPQERVNDTLALMRLPQNTPVNPKIGREVCLRDGGIRALIAGKVEKVGSAFVLSAQLIEPASGRMVASFEEDATSQAGVLPAVHALSNDVRQALGQKLSEIQQSDIALQKVTTPSLKALQLYSQADQEMRDDGSQAAAFELLQQAITEDPNFASAYILAAYTLANQRKPPADFLPYAQKALELSNQASDSERYFIEGSYNEMTNEPDHAIASYQALMRVNPGHFWGSNNLSGLLIAQNRMQEIVELSVHRAEAEPNNFDWNWGAGYTLLLTSARQDLARPYFQRTGELLSAMTDLERNKYAGEALFIQLYPAYEAWLRDDVSLARSELERAEQNPVAHDGATGPLMFGAFRQALGETQRAKAWLQQASEPTDKTSVGFAEIATLAFLCGDDAAARRWLERMPPDRIPMGMSLLVREGMLRQANALAQKYNEWRPQFRNVAMGELLLAQGKTPSGTRLLRAGLDEQRMHAYPTYFLGADSLARAYEKEGNFSAALEVLQAASADRVRANGPFSMSGATLWMETQMDLARLYRRLHRVKDAEKIEDELHNLLTYADPDYPMLVELKHLQSNPSVANRSN